LASFELTTKDSCVRNVENIISHHQKFSKKLKALEKGNFIKNVRQLGTIIAFEMRTSENDDYLNNISKNFTEFSMKHGVYLRSMGNTIYVMPPYCTTSRQLKKIYSVIIHFIEKYKEQNKAD
jgi:adenosylmethionine-8-amino-7-oxononanoate aminotransferase